MRLTQAIHWLNANPIPTRSWMDASYSHFSPTEEDGKAREEYLKRRSTKRRKKMKDIFG